MNQGYASKPVAIGRLLLALFTFSLLAGLLALPAGPAHAQADLVGICGNVWVDTNCNGVKDGLDFGLNGVPVLLYDGTGTTLLAVQITKTVPGLTSPDGFFDFAFLPRALYRVRIVVLPGYTASAAYGGEASAHATPIDNHTLLINTLEEPTRTVFSPDVFLVCQQNGGNGATRTPGFWATHLAAMQTAVNQGCIQLGACGDPAPVTLGRVEAIMWGSISHQGKTKRSELGHARMQLGQHLVAAYANQCLLGTSPSGFTLAQATAALNGTDVAQIRSMAAALDVFNNSGDAIALTGTQIANVGNATPQAAQAAADTTNGEIDPGPCFQ